MTQSKIEPGQICSSFDDFLTEQGNADAINAVAIKHVIAFQ